MRPPNYTRRGFRLRGNTLVLLFFFFLVGLFLHYGGRTQPVVAFWNDVKGLFGIRPERGEPAANPYKAPEPTQKQPDILATEQVSDGGLPGGGSQRSDDESVATATNGPESEAARSGNERFAFEKEVDFLLPAFRSTDQVVRHDGYVLRYQEPYEQPDWVAYPLLANDVTGEAERDREQFRPDPAVRTGSATPADYARSGYDRGHLAPAGDFKFSQRMMRETFLMSNMSPQAPDFNRGIWRELEELVRRWAVRDRGLYVVTGPVLRAGLPTIGRQNQVAVPEQYYKVLLYCNAPDIRMIGFLLRNEGSDASLKQFVVPVADIERATGITFFPKIPGSLAQTLKNQPRSRMVAEWFGR